MDTRFLTIPIKRPNDLNIVNSFKSQSLYTKDATKFENLQKLRNEVTKLIKNEKFTDESLDLLLRYVDQITSLKSKIPHKVSWLSIQWVDAFKTTFGTSGQVLPYLDYERISLLFNIAAFESQLGNKCKNSGRDEDLKIGAKWLQSAAGMLEQIKMTIQNNQNLKEDLKGANDFNEDTLSSLSHLMLSQAQELFVVKSIKDGMKESLIAKLCVQAEAFYSETLSLMTKQSVKFIWDKNWLPHVSGKQLAYNALSQYFQSKHCGNMKNVGEQIARLKLFLDQQKKVELKIANSFVLEQYKGEATRMLAEAAKDNDFIYHELVPEPQNLSPIELTLTARLAKIIPPAQFLANTPTDFQTFDDLICEDKRSEQIEKEKASKTVKAIPKFHDKEERVHNAEMESSRNQGGFVQYIYDSFGIITGYLQSFFAETRPSQR